MYAQLPLDLPHLIYSILWNHFYSCGSICVGIQNFPGSWGLSWNQAYVQDFNVYIYNFTQIQETWKTVNLRSETFGTKLMVLLLENLIKIYQSILIYKKNYFEIVQWQLRCAAIAMLQGKYFSPGILSLAVGCKSVFILFDITLINLPLIKTVSLEMFRKSSVVTCFISVQRKKIVVFFKNQR